MATILLVTVTKIEAQAALKACQKATGKPWNRKTIGDKIYCAFGQIDGAEVYMVQSEIGTSTPGGALITVHKAIEALYPEVVIMVGIAFGARPATSEKPDGQQLGDIMVARQIMAYEPGKEKGKFIPRGDRVTCSTALLDKFRSGDMDWLGAKVWFGLVLSGEKLVNDLAFRSHLLKIEPEAIGGEMEGAGLYVAATDAKTDWILVKAICDWADGAKNDKAQPLAADNAAEFVLHVIKLGGWENIGGKEAMPKGKSDRVSIKQKTGDHATQIGQARDVNINSGPVYNIQGGIHAAHDVVIGDQTNFNYSVENVRSAAEFVAVLTTLQTQIVALKQQAELNNAQRRTLETAGQAVAQAAAEAQKPRPEVSQVKQTLTDAKETLEMLSGSVKAAVGLGGALAGLITLASKLFGG